MQKPENSQNISLNASILNSLYLGKKIVYRFFKGEIINIAYYSDLEPVPYAEVRLTLWNNRTVTKIMKLSDVVIVASGKVKKDKKSKKSKVAA